MKFENLEMFRFALRAQLQKTEIVDDFCEVAALLDNVHMEVEQFQQLSDSKWMVCYTPKNHAVVEHRAHNPILALWYIKYLSEISISKTHFRTTSAARCHLLKHLQGVYGDMVRSEQHKIIDPLSKTFHRRDVMIIYMDTVFMFQFSIIILISVKGFDNLCV